MAWKDDSGAAYSGGSGQMAVIAELLHRRCNAAVPHIDVGTDVFAFRDDGDAVARIQVKTSPGTRYRKGEGYSAKFGVPLKQLERRDEPHLFYVLAVRLDDGWGSFVVVSRARLQELQSQNLGSVNRKSGDLELHIQFRPDAKQQDKLTAVCGTFDLTTDLNAWEVLPPLRPPTSSVG